jgi:large subunit ribosomal protein L15
MNLNELRPNVGAAKKAKRLGRGIGSGFGKTCGRGHKGQKSRSGGKVACGFEGGQTPLYRRLPKSGFSSAIGRRTAKIRLFELNKIKQGEGQEAVVVDLDSLKQAGLIAKHIKRVKVFLSGTYKGPLTFSKQVTLTRGVKQSLSIKD